MNSLSITFNIKLINAVSISEKIFPLTFQLNVLINELSGSPVSWNIRPPINKVFFLNLEDNPTYHLRNSREGATVTENAFCISYQVRDYPKVPGSSPASGNIFSLIVNQFIIENICSLITKLNIASVKLLVVTINKAKKNFRERADAWDVDRCFAKRAISFRLLSTPWNFQLICLIIL